MAEKGTISRESTSINPGPTRYRPPTFTLACRQSRNDTVMSPVTTASRNSLLKCTEIRSYSDSHERRTRVKNTVSGGPWRDGPSLTRGNFGLPEASLVPDAWKPLYVRSSTHLVGLKHGKMKILPPPFGAREWPN